MLEPSNIAKLSMPVVQDTARLDTTRPASARLHTYVILV